MGLIDEVRKRRDSWMKRYEEQRQDEYGEEPENLSEEEIQKRIEENRKKVGVFDKDKRQRKS